MSSKLILSLTLLALASFGTAKPSAKDTEWNGVEGWHDELLTPIKEVKMADSPKTKQFDPEMGPDVFPEDPGMMDPGMMDPAMMDPGMMDPAMMDPGMMDPGMMDPAMMDPGMMDPEMMDPAMDPWFGKSDGKVKADQSKQPKMRVFGAERGGETDKKKGQSWDPSCSVGCDVRCAEICERQNQEFTGGHCVAVPKCSCECI